MKRQHLAVILVVLAIGLLLYAPTLIQSPDTGEDPASIEDAFRAEGIDAAAAQRIRIRHPDGDTALIERTELGWRMNGRKADSLKVVDLLSAIDTMAAMRVVARNPENHPRLEVSAETGRSVELHDPAGGTFRFYVGRRDLGTGAYHVRRDGDDRVWLLDGPVGGFAGRVIENWRERVLARVDTASVREILVRRGDSEVVLERGTGGWSLADGAPADSSAVQALLRRLPELFSTDFAPDSVAATADFSAPDAVLSVLTAQVGDLTERQLVVSLRFLRREDGEPWLVKRAGEPEVYELSEMVVESLVPTRERILAGEGDA